MVENKKADSIVEEAAVEEGSEHIELVTPTTPLTLSFTEPLTRFIKEFENEIGNNPLPEWSHLTLEALHQMMNEESDALYVAMVEMNKEKIAEHCLKISTLSFYFSTSVSRGMTMEKPEGREEKKGKKKSSSTAKKISSLDFNTIITNSMSRDYSTEGQYTTYPPTFSNTGSRASLQG